MEVAIRSEAAARRVFALRGSIVLWLGGLVALSAVVRTAAAWLRSTPNYYVDEYLYSSLGRSLATHGSPAIRGAPAHFPALLQPLLTAPAWLVHDVATAYRAVQALDSLYMSLAAIPVYLIARRLRVSREASLAAAALSVAVPDAIYSSMTLSEPVAYPLALAALAAALAALERPTGRNQVLFFAFAGLTVFARVQFAMLPACYVVAVAVVAVRERTLRRSLREQLLPLALVAAGTVAVLVHGLRANIGYYPSFLNVHTPFAHAAHVAGSNALVLLYASGWVLVPGAVLGAVLAVARPRFRAEVAFVGLAAPFALFLLVQASLYGANESTQERYVFYLLPLVAVAFCLYASRGWPLRLVHAGVAATLAAVAAAVPVAGLASRGSNAHSPLLWAVDRLALATGNASEAALLLAAVATALSLVVVAASFRPRLATPLALVVALGGLTAVSAAAVSYDRTNVASLRATFLPADRSWVDDARVGRVSMLVGPSGSKTDLLDQLFWNPTVDRVLLLPHATPSDPFAATSVGVAADGTVLVGGRALTGPVLTDQFGVWSSLRDARLVQRTRTAALWQPRGRARLSLLMLGRYYDGWLGPAGALIVWPERAGGAVSGWLSFRVSTPVTTPLELHPSAGARVRVVLRPGEARVVRLPVCANGVWSASLSANPTGVVNLRTVSVRAGAPVFRPDPAVCRVSSARGHVPMGTTG